MFVYKDMLLQNDAPVNRKTKDFYIGYVEIMRAIFTPGEVLCAGW